MKNERYILTDGIVYITHKGAWTRDLRLAMKWNYRPERELADCRVVFGSSLTIKRVHLDTWRVR